MTEPVPPSPQPRRLGRPRWLDLRVIGGILLLVAAVVIGSRVIASSSQTVPVWSATRDLSVGTVLAAGDLIAADVNLGEVQAQYLGTGSDPVGRTVVDSVRRGELLPAAAVAEPAENGRVLVIPVPPDKFPPGVGHGSVIDLYLTEDTGTAGGQVTETTLLRSGLTVQSVTAPATGGISGATANQYQVAVEVDEETADLLVRSLPSGEAVVVLVTG
jgi:hypothetical protein